MRVSSQEFDSTLQSFEYCPKSLDTHRQTSNKDRFHGTLSYALPKVTIQHSSYELFAMSANMSSIATAPTISISTTPSAQSQPMHTPLPLSNLGPPNTPHIESGKEVVVDAGGGRGSSGAADDDDDDINTSASGANGYGRNGTNGNSTKHSAGTGGAAPAWKASAFIAGVAAAGMAL